MDRTIEYWNPEPRHEFLVSGRGRGISGPACAKREQPPPGMDGYRNIRK